VHPVKCLGCGSAWEETTIDEISGQKGGVKKKRPFCREGGEGQRNKKEKGSSSFWFGERKTRAGIGNAVKGATRGNP